MRAKILLALWATLVLNAATRAETSSGGNSGGQTGSSAPGDNSNATESQQAAPQQELQKRLEELQKRLGTLEGLTDGKSLDTAEEEIADLRQQAATGTPLEKKIKEVAGQIEGLRLARKKTSQQQSSPRSDQNDSSNGGKQRQEKEEQQQQKAQGEQGAGGAGAGGGGEGGGGKSDSGMADAAMKIDGAKGFQNMQKVDDGSGSPVTTLAQQPLNDAKISEIGKYLGPPSSGGGGQLSQGKIPDGSGIKPIAIDTFQARKSRSATPRRPVVISQNPQVGGQRALPRSLASRGEIPPRAAARLVARGIETSPLSRPRSPRAASGMPTGSYAVQRNRSAIPNRSIASAQMPRSSPAVGPAEDLSGEGSAPSEGHRVP